MRNAALATLPGTFAPEAEDDFTGLYRELHPQLFRYVTHHFGLRDADEITQEALARALRSLDRRRTEAETWAWLIRVARNVAADLARARRVCESTDDETVLKCDAPDDATLPEPAVLLDERRRIVRRALTRLPITQRQVLLLYEVDELNCPTIARLVGSTEDAVRKTLQRARRRFAAEFRTLGGGVAGSLGVLLRGVPRWRRRLVRSLPTVSASSAAVVALAGTFALHVTGSASLPVVRPNLDDKVAVSTADMDARDAAASAGRLAGSPGATGHGAETYGTGTPGGKQHAVIRIPSTPLSPGKRTVVIHQVVTVPLVGPVEIKDELWTSDGHGPVCDLESVGIYCE